MNKRITVLLGVLIVIGGFIPSDTKNIYALVLDIFNIRKGIADAYVFESMMRFLLPQIIFFACFGDYFNTNIINNACMLFIRNKKNNYVVNKYAKMLLIKVVVSVLSVYAIIIFLRILQSRNLESNCVVLLLFWVVNYAVYMAFSIMVANVLAIFVGAAEATAIVFFVKIVEVMILAKAVDNNIYDKISKVIPISIIAGRTNYLEKSVTKTVFFQYFLIPFIVGAILCLVTIRICGRLLNHKEWF